MPEPTNTPSAPSCIMSAASAGVASPPAEKFTTGSRPSAATLRTSSSGARSSFAAEGKLPGVHGAQTPDPGLDRAHVPDGLDHVAGARLALRADHRGALRDAAQSLAEVGGAAHERDLETPLVDVVRLVRWSKHLGLVDVVDLERLQDLRLDEVADAGLRHHGDRDRLLDLADLGRIRHARHTALGADVRGHALERHHRARACLLGDPSLVGVRDVHDHAAFQHLGKPALDAECGFLTHVSEFSQTGLAARVTEFGSSQFAEPWP